MKILEEAVTMILDANRELSEQSLEGAEVIREPLILPAIWKAETHDIRKPKGPENVRRSAPS
jgi:hypothetical protein